MAVIEMLSQAILDTREEEYCLPDGTKKTKTSFWASESEIMAFDIFHRWKGTPETHPMDEEKMLMLKMRKLTEEAIVGFFKRTGKLVDRFTNQERVLIEWGPNKVPISGYPDLGLDVEGEPIIVEVKTYYGQKNHSEVRVGKVKPAYLKQLAIYMWHYNIDHGVLFLINQGTGEMYEFDLYRQDQQGVPPGYAFICPDNEMVINLHEVFTRFEKIWENIQKDVEPEIEYTYKYDIEKIDWSKVPVSAISKARNNKAVIGDWQCKYSNFKGLIAQRQGTTLGYTDEEVARIIELTAGYSVKKSNAIKFDPKAEFEDA